MPSVDNAPHSPILARGGFHPATQPMLYVMGDRGTSSRFCGPTRCTRRRSLTVENKILWVSRVVAMLPDPLRIQATLHGTGRTATREVTGGPGPSIINLPTAGCWSFNLSWAGYQDHLELRYVVG